MSEQVELVNEEVVDQPKVEEQEVENVETEPSRDVEAKDKEIALGKAFAGAKKSSFEKGRQDGLAEARKLLETEEVPEQNIAPVAPTNNNDVMFNNKAMSIEAEGNAKYEDFGVKVNEALKKAENNPTLSAIYRHAVTVGNADTMWDLMTNKDKRLRMLEDRKCWDKELFTINSSETKKVVNVKNPPSPLSELKGSPAKGESSYKDNKQFVLKQNGLI